MSSRALKGGVFKALLLFSLFVGLLMLVVLVIDVFLDGLPYLDLTLLTKPPSSDPNIAGARPAILATLYIGLLLLLFVVPIGVGTALYLWARKESRLTAFTRPELVIFVVVALTSVLAVVLMTTGNLSVL